MAMSRGELLKKTESGAGLPAMPAVAGAAESAAGTSKTTSVRLGITGVGCRGTGLMIGLLAHPGVGVPAIRDVTQGEINRASAIVRRATGELDDSFSGSALGQASALLAQHRMSAIGPGCCEPGTHIVAPEVT